MIEVSRPRLNPRKARDGRPPVSSADPARGPRSLSPPPPPPIPINGRGVLIPSVTVPHTVVLPMDGHTHTHTRRSSHTAHATRLFRLSDSIKEEEDSAYRRTHLKAPFPPASLCLAITTSTCPALRVNTRRYALRSRRGQPTVNRHLGLPTARRKARRPEPSSSRDASFDGLEEDGAMKTSG